MIEFLTSLALLSAFAAGWIILGAVGAAIQLWADRKLPTHHANGLDSFSGRVYCAMLVILGPLAIVAGLGSALSSALFAEHA